MGVESNERLQVLGCVMARVADKHCRDVKEVPEGKITLAFGIASATQDGNLIETSQMRDLCEVGYISIGIVAVILGEINQFFIHPNNDISDELRLAVEDKADEVVLNQFRFLINSDPAACGLGRDISQTCRNGWSV